MQTHLGNADEVSIVIASYDYSSKLIKRFPHVKWDFLIIDEAHNLRNVFHGTKRAKNLYDLTHGIPKILLTATPLQNSLTDLHGLVSFIDPRIFGSEKVFNRRFVDGCDYEELKQELLPVLYRTLRRDVGKYMAFSKRTCITVDFHLSAEEKELYDVTNDFLRRDPLYSIPNANRGLIILVIRKLLASSSFALIETFEVLEKRLEKLYEGTKSAYAQEGFDLFWGFVEDEIDEDGFNEYDDEETAEKKQAIQAELKIVRHILEMARAIKTNAKIAALREALKSAFDHQISEGLNQKAVVFTESNDGAAAIDKLTDEQLNEVKALIMNRLNIIKPSAKADAEHEIDDFISNWKLLATQSKELRYYVYTTKTYNRLMNTYGEVCTDLEKPTLRSMRDVERAANMFYYTED